MKKLFASLVLLLSLTLVFAYNGMLSGEKELKVVSTQWFDIIYPPSGEYTASLLYDNADKIYEEIAELYGRKIIYRMPVVITTKVENFNAYFSTGYYNHIVLYDTYQISELSVFSDTMLSTFRHELTHAYTFNLSDPFWRTVKSIFGEALSPVGVNISSGWAEGATLTSESSFGEGRLNDDYSKKIVRQAKLENKFPKYKNVKGDSDIYPYGSYYYFNGAFNQYLQEKYGMELYSKFWYEAVNLHHVFATHVFKKVYKKNLNKEWQNFAKEYKVPEIPGNPVQANLTNDFFEKNKADYSPLNKTGYIFEELSLSEKGLTYVDSYASGAVFFISKEDLLNETVKPKKLFVTHGISSAKQSADGKYISFVSYTTAKPTIQQVSGIYNTETKKITKFAENGIGEAIIVKSENDYYFVEVCFNSQNYKIRVSKLNENCEKTEIVSETKLPFEVFPNSFVDLQNGTFAFIKKDKLNWSICVYDLSGNLLSEYKSPFERMVLRNLSYSNGEIYFSYTKPGKMPDLGKLNLSNNTYEFRNSDISGGIYYPVCFEDTLIYSGEFYRMNRILTMNPEFTESVSAEITKEDYSVEEISKQPSNTFISATKKDFNGFSFYKKGLFLPFSQLSSYGILDNKNVNLPFGITYMTRNPWDGNQITLGAGYGIYTNSAAIQLKYSSGTDTSLFNYGITGQLEMDGRGFKEGLLAGSVSSSYPFGKISYFVVSLYSENLIGRENNVDDSILETIKTPADYFGIYAPIYSDINFSSLDGISLYYSNTHKAFPGRHQRAGVSAGTEIYYNLISNVNNNQGILLSAGNVGLFANFYIPRLIPIYCVSGFEYNLPTTIKMAAYPSSSTIEDMVGDNLLNNIAFPNGFMFTAETVLFSKEIQYAIPTQLVFLNYISVSAICSLGYSLPEGYDNWNILYTPSFVNEICNNNVGLFVSPGIKVTLGATPVVVGMYKTHAAVNFVKTESGFEPKVSLGINASF